MGLRSTTELRIAPARYGRLAQLVERFVYTEDVGGSSPSSPTIAFKSFAIDLRSGLQVYRTYTSREVANLSG